MKSDLYAWSYGNNSDWVELTFNYSPIEKKSFNISEDEILEIAERIKAKRFVSQLTDGGKKSCSHCANNRSEKCKECRIDMNTLKATMFEEK